jgi:Holliday junction resolvase RusA-like endonuclease
MKIVIPGKPMSANRMEGIRAVVTKDGRKFTQTYPTEEYKNFLTRFKEATDSMEWEFDTTKPLKITLTPKFSNKASDLDNVAKPTLDALQHVFDWNDKYVYEIHMYKELVKKGEERLDIFIEELKETD